MRSNDDEKGDCGYMLPGAGAVSKPDLCLCSLSRIFLTFFLPVSGPVTKH